MTRFALVGKNIQHSKSKEIYEKLLGKSVDYTLLDFEDHNSIPKAKVLLDTYSAISITAPYKQHFLDQLDLNLSPISAVNALRLNKGKLEGENTDYLATQEILDEYIQSDILNYFLVGDGVMANLVIHILNNKNIDFTQFSRKLKNMDKLKDSPKSKTLIINTCARDYLYKGSLSKLINFWDMNYNLDSHAQLFKNSDAHYVDGLGLLELQAKYALSFWNLDKP